MEQLTPGVGKVWVERHRVGLQGNDEQLRRHAGTRVVSGCRIPCRLPARRMVQHAVHHDGMAVDLGHQVRSLLSSLTRLETTNWCNIAAGLFGADLFKVSKQGGLKSS